MGNSLHEKKEGYQISSETKRVFATQRLTWELQQNKLACDRHLTKITHLQSKLSAEEQKLLACLKQSTQLKVAIQKVMPKLILNIECKDYSW